MSCPINQDSLDQLKQFVEVCKVRPEILHLPQLSFFKNYLESFGVKIPTPKTQSSKPTETPLPEEPTEPTMESDDESDLEIDNTGCIDPDEPDNNQIMGDPDKEVTEEDSDKADELRGEAMSEFVSSNYEKSIELYSKAIETNPHSALLFAKRGQVQLKLNKPNACIKDCTKALELNPDSAAAYKFRGWAYRLLGEWQKAAKDLRQAVNIDFDEQSNEWLKEVTPNASKIEQHNLKKERRKLEKEEKERINRAREARAAHAAAAANAKAESPTADDIPTAGGPGGAGLGDFYKMMQDPDVMAAFKDPEVCAAFQDISMNPQNFVRYTSNPKIMALISKFQGGTAPNFPFFGAPGGGAPGGMPAEGAAPTMPHDDDNLD